MSIAVNAQYIVDDLAQNEVSVAGSEVHYVFPEGGILGGKKVIETLKDLMTLVRDIIEAFAALVRSRC